MNSAGVILEEYNYDPWGRRRNPVNWSYSNVSAPTYTSRGFTGHEHLDMFNMIHMNGRIYDPETARFLSPDPIIKDPYNLLCYNRYSYCLNNPLKYSDPTGYILRRPEEPSPIIDWSSYYNYGYRTTPGGGTGGGAGGGLNGYTYFCGVYYDSQGNSVPFTEVLNNAILPVSPYIPNASSVIIGENGIYVKSVSVTSVKRVGKVGSANFDVTQEISFSLTFFSFNDPSGQGGNNPIECVGSVNDIALATAMGYNALDNVVKRKYAYQLSKHINAKPGNIYQSAKSFGKSSAKVLGKTASVVAVGSIAYDFGTGTANTATLVDAGMLIGGAATVAILGTVAAPFVVGAGVVYGVGCLFGFDDYLNETLDISKSINFINP